MNEEFSVVFTADKLYNAEMIKNILEINNINATILNQKDSAYKIGEIMVYVAKEEEERAKKIIQEARDD